MLVVYIVDIGTGQSEYIAVSRTDSVSYLKRKVALLKGSTSADIDIVIDGEALPDDVILSTKSDCDELMVYWVDKRRAHSIVL